MAIEDNLGVVVETNGALTGLTAADVSAISSAVDNARAANTTAAYRSAWTAWQAWADEKGTSALPATPATVAAYLAHRAGAGASLATVRLAKAAIAAAHKETGADSPCGSPLVEKTVKGLARAAAEAGNAAQKQAAAPDRRSTGGHPRHRHRTANGPRRTPGVSRHRQAPGTDGHRPLRRHVGRRPAALGSGGAFVGRRRAGRRRQRQGDDPPVKNRQRRRGRRGRHYRARHGRPRRHTRPRR